MRLPVDLRPALPALALSAALAGCSFIPGRGGDVASLDAPPVAIAAASGPAADYPMVLGDPFSVDGQVYTPADTMNYDAVGYAGVEAGSGITVSHRTLPLPSYVEVTSLSTGKTILARVERRGPMAGSHLVALSTAAAAQLGGGEGTPVRVRRVSPQETARALLRAGQPAPEPIETPKALVEVLRRKLPANGAAMLNAPPPPRVAQSTSAATAKPARIANASAAATVAPTVAPRRELPPAKVAAAPASRPAPFPVAASAAPAAASVGAPRAVAAYPLPPLGGATKVVPRATVVARTEPVAEVPVAPARQAAAAPAAAPRQVVRQAAPAAGDGFVIQAGAFSNRASAQRVADALDGYVSPSGKLYRVRTGPFTSRGQAEAALAKVRAAGYSDARVYTAG